MEGVYTIQDQNIGPPLRGTMTVTEASAGVFNWETGYSYLAFPDNDFWAKGVLVNDGGEWGLSMYSTSEPDAMPYEGLPVRVNFSNNTLSITLDDGRAMIWRKR